MKKTNWPVWKEVFGVWISIKEAGEVNQEVDSRDKMMHIENSDLRNVIGDFLAHLISALPVLICM